MSRQEILDQVAYLVDELEAQQVVLSVIPAPVWEARPPTDPRSLEDMYRGMLEFECEGFPEEAGISALPKPTWEGKAGLLQAIGRVRSANLERIRQVTWTPAVEEACYRATQSDADRLREIGLRLNETALGAPRVKEG